MRAFVINEFGAPPRTGELPEPICGPDDIVIDVSYAGLNFADLLLMDGTYQALSDPPFAVGFESAGTVLEIGSNVTSHAIGDRVVALAFGGAIAERRSVDADWAFPVPSTMSFREAAGWFVPYSTAHHALIDRGYIAAGESLLVLGASGGVGQAAVALGRALGATVIGAVSTDEKAKAITALGAHHIVRYDRESLSDRVLEITNGQGVDVVFDPVGGDQFRDAVRSTGFLGRLLIVGFASGAVPEISMNLPLVKGISLVGVDMGRYVRERPSLAAEAHTELVEWWEDEVLDNLITRVIAFDDLEGIHDDFTNRSVLGKWVVAIAASS